ncbi:prepilin peptidase [Microbaculum sp. FT89]|uniref:prepilin peptidase n=1 Tax=Microbaculum sp. FT89 TaxID=3447298 RepID=UPI003F52DDF0
MTLSPSSRRHLIAAAGGAALGAVAALALVDGAARPDLISASAVLGAAMAAIALEDALRLRVPDPWVYGALVTGIVWSISMRLRSGDGLVAAGGAVLIAVAVCGGAFLAVREAFYRLRGVDGLGFGDVKLAAAGGAWLGWEGFAFAVLVAAAGALAFVVTRVGRGRGWNADQRLAFGAFLAPAMWATWLVLQGAGDA